MILCSASFWMEELKGGGEIYDCIKAWEKMKSKYEAGEIPKEEYFQLKLTYTCPPLTDTAV